MRILAESGNFEEIFVRWVGFAAIGIEVLAVAIIVVAIAYSTLDYLRHGARQTYESDENYAMYKRRLGKALLLGLEILVAADIVRTVALESTLSAVAVLGLLVLIRTFLSWSLVVEIEGRWPWRPAPESEEG